MPWVLALAACRLSVVLFVGAVLVPAAAATQSQANPPVHNAAPIFDATHLNHPTEVSSTWLVHAGDDPAYAQPDFDDSHWTPFDPHTNLKLLFPNSQPDIVWYRLRIQFEFNQSGMALLENHLASAWELYANGQRLFANGKVSPFEPYTISALNLIPLPDSMTRTGLLVLALRVHISPLEWDSPGPGYAAANLKLGPAASLREHRTLALVAAEGPNCVIVLFGFSIGIFALALYTAQRDRLEYLWIFLQSVFVAAAIPLTSLFLLHDIPARWAIVTTIPNGGSILFEILIFLRLLRRPFGPVARWLAAFSVLGVVVATVGQFFGNLPQGISLLVQAPLMYLVAIALPFLAVREFRKGNREAGLLLIPILLSSLTIYAQIVGIVAIRIPALTEATVQWLTFLFRSQIGPFTVGLGEVVNLLYFLSLGLIIVLRSTRMSRQQAVLESELEAAREVQQVILPEHAESIPGFAVECVYQPAQQVGGDFFQIIPATDGGLLLILGDVAGKGLPAAMLVSVLVGATRTAVRYTQAPNEILVELNERLIGRARGAFSTALAAHFAPDGTLSIANAGHLCPYLDGRELELPVALPLGILSGAFYPTTQFHLAPGSRIVFYSDGVIEAQNPKGELLGFDRARELSTLPAETIAQAAKSQGQSDDITVVAIARSPAASAAA